MRPAVEAPRRAALLILLLAALPVLAQEQADEDLAAAVAELDALDQPPSALDLADLADQAQQHRDAGPWSAFSGQARLRWRRDRDGGGAADALAEAGAASWSLRLRARRSASGDDLMAGTAAGTVGALGLRLGGWTWRHGFGLAAGGAGRSGALAADGSLGPGSGGGRGWTGSPEPGSAVGAAVGWRGPWSADAAWGRREDGTVLTVTSLGHPDGAWQLVAVADGPSGLAGGAAGRWRRGPWRGAWEVALRPAAAAPAVGCHVGWDVRRFALASVLVAVPRGPAWEQAAAQPLLGSRAGTLCALRGTWRPRPGASIAALVAVAARDGGDLPAPEHRLVSDILGRTDLAAGLEAEARLRTTARTVWEWAEAWPWAAPIQAPGRRTQVLGLALGRRQETPRWRLRLVSLAVDHAPTAGRRTLAGAEVRDGGAGPVAWRLAWRVAWGAPVDLVDAVSPLPGLVVPRHWGRWSGGWFAGIGLTAGPWALDAAADLREAMGGGRSLELWAGARARW